MTSTASPAAQLKTDTWLLWHPPISLLCNCAITSMGLDSPSSIELPAKLGKYPAICWRLWVLLQRRWPAGSSLYFRSLIGIFRAGVTFQRLLKCLSRNRRF